VPDEEREEFYQQYWNNIRYKVFTRIFLSRKLMCLLFDRRFYSYLEPGFDFNKYYRSVIKRAITELPVRENNFLSYVLTGTYTKESLPVYLQRKNFEKIRENLDRIEIIHSSCIDFLKGLQENTIDQFNFTNIFEWMSVEEYTNYLEECIRCGKEGSVIIYRNHLVTRRRPGIMKDSIVPEMKLSKELHKQDLSFIYKDYVIEKIKK
jgi:S-adenosylmethionine-diacylglycerol 3-amino-3-carboxypropyl transferase